MVLVEAPSPVGFNPVRCPTPGCGKALAEVIVGMARFKCSRCKQPATFYAPGYQIITEPGLAVRIHCVSARSEAELPPR